MTVRAKALRRRSRPSLAVRIRTFWVVGALAAVAVLALAVALVNAPQLRVARVDATVPDGSPVTRAMVLDAAHVERDANLWLLDTAAMRGRIEAIPYVATATVHRAQWPQPSVALAIALRSPAGCVRSGPAIVTIDATSRVLQSGCTAPQLPLVDIGPGAPNPPGTTLSAPDVQRLLGDAKAVGDRIPLRSAHFDRFGGLEAVDTRGVVLKFGADDDLAAKIALVEPVRRSAGDRPLRAIDLRAPSTPVVEFP